MAKIPISKLPQATSVAANNEIPIVQSGVTKKALIEDVGKEVNITQQYSDLNTTDKTPIGAINELAAKPCVDDTWRAIKVNGTEKLGNAISSGSVDFVDTDNVKFEFDANGNKVKATLSGIDTSAQVDEKVAGIIDDTEASASKVYSSNKVVDLIASQNTQEVREYTFTTGAYIKVNVAVGSTVNLSPVSSSGKAYLIVDCVEGDTFNIKVTGATNYRAYAFVDINNVLLSVADINEAYSGVIEAPQNASKMILGANTSYEYSCNQFENKWKVADAFLWQTYDNSWLAWEQGTISGTDGSLVHDTKTIRTFIDNTIAKIRRIKFTCTSGYTYAFRCYDALNNFIATISFTSGDSSINYYMLPSNTAKIGICLRYTSNITPSNSSNITVIVTGDAINNSVDNKIDEINSDVDAIGHFRVDDTLASKLAVALGYNANQKYVNFAYFTDTHSNDNDARVSINYMNAIVKSKTMDACVHGGDLITTYDLDFDGYVKAMFENMVYYKNFAEMLFCKGNHDNNHAAVLGDNATIYQYHMLMQNNYSGVVFNSSHPCTNYFYKDFEYEKVRMIVVDSFTVAGSSATVQIDSDQLDWLYNTALDVEDGWTVLAISHMFMDTLTDACNLFNAFNDRGTTYGSYTFANDKTTHFVGVIHGHEHTDNFSNTIGFNIIGVTKAYGLTGAVDIFTIDTDNLKLYETRIGDGISREFTFT